MTDHLHRFIRQFTCVAPVAVTYTMDNTPFTGRVREVRRVTEYRDRTSYRSSDSSDYSFAAGFVLGTAL